MPGSAFDPSPPVADPWTDKLGRFVDSVAFQRFILGSILAAAVIVGLEADRSLMARYGGLIYALDWTVLGIFIVEAILKIARHGRHGHRYFKDPWNVFDFTIVVVCLLPFQGHYAAVLRLARVLRALRLVSSVPRLQLLVGSLMRSIPSMGYIGMLLGILFYIYAVLGVFLFRDNDPVHFGNLPTAALSLFRVVTLEDWTDIMYTQMLGSDIYPPENVPPEIELRPGAMPLVGAVYFISFVLLGTMIMLNLFIGVIVNSMDESQAEQERTLRRKHIEATGEPTLADDLTELEHEMQAIQKRIADLRERAK
jgi:voltage-gated sodium channel